MIFSFFFSSYKVITEQLEDQQILETEIYKASFNEILESSL